MNEGSIEIFLNLLENSHKQTCLALNETFEKAEFVAEFVFDFTTYDGDFSSKLGRKAVEVCCAISEKKTFDYIKNLKDYEWYLLMINMPFFKDKLEWGASVRGAWWRFSDLVTIESCGFYNGENQLEGLQVKFKEWDSFVFAMRAFIDGL